MDPLRLAIVGCGSIARNGYVPRCQHYPRHLHLIGFFDQDPEAARALQRQAGAGRVYAALDDLLGDPEVEAVLNLTTVGGHHPVSLRALQAGKHVYSEKPLAITGAQADQLLRTAEAQGRVLACAPSSALGDEQQDAWARLRAGEIGTPHTVIGQFACTRLECWHPAADVFMTSGISVLADAAPYPLTLMTTFFGPVRRLFGFSRLVIPERILEVGPRAGAAFTATVPDNVLALLEFDQGVRGFVFSGWTGPSQTPPLEITGTDGGLLLSPHNDGAGVRFFSVRSSETRPLPTPPGAFANGLDWGKGVVDFADAIRQGRPPRCSGYQGRHLVEITEKLNEASSTGRLTELTTTFAPPEPVGTPAPWDA